MNPFERLEWINKIRLGTDMDAFDGMQNLATARLIEQGSSPRIAEWFERQIGKVSTRIFNRLTKIVNKQVGHPLQYFDDEELDVLFDLEEDEQRGFERSDACQFTNQIKTAYYTFVNQFTSHNKKTSFKENSSFGITMKKILNRLNNRMREKMVCV